MERASSNTSAAGLAKLEAMEQLSKIDEAIQSKRDELSVMQNRLQAIESECRETQEVCPAVFPASCHQPTTLHL